MITEQDLQEAIAECLGERSPNANTCVKLAAFYTIRDQLYPAEDRRALPAYSFSPPPASSYTVPDLGDTPFYKAIAGRDTEDLWPILDEIFTALRMAYPRLYDLAMRKLQ